MVSATTIGAAHVAQKQEEDDGDQDHAFGEVVLDRVHGVIRPASERSRKGTTLTPLGSRMPLFSLSTSAWMRLQHRVGVVAFLQQDDAFDGVGVVDNGAVGPVRGAADLAEADLGALGDRGDVPDPDRRAVLRLHDGVFNVLHDW